MSSEIDKPSLYGEYLRGELAKRQQGAWREKLWRKVAFKASDIADDEEDPMQIHVRKGIGLGELIAIGALLASGMGGTYFLARPVQPLPQPPAVQPAPAVSEPPAEASQRPDKSRRYHLRFAEPKSQG